MPFSFIIWKNAIPAFIVALVLSLLAMNSPVTADEIKRLEQKIEYLKQKNILDAQLQDIQGKIQELESNYKGVLKPPSSSNEVNSSKVSSNNSSGVTPFSDIMKLMEDKDIKLSFSGGFRPFKVFKDGDKWILEQQLNYENSVIVDAGDNKITVDGFPGGWVINGTWKFSKDGNKCRIDHTSDSAIMAWNC